MLKPFLTANWRYLATLNFAVDPEISRASCGVAVTGTSVVVRFTRYFSDHPNRQRKALQAARAYREKLLSRLPPPKKIKIKE